MRARSFQNSGKIREDSFLIACKLTANDSEEEQRRAYRALFDASVNNVALSISWNLA
jgi:hypothetical protein